MKKPLWIKHAAQLVTLASIVKGRHSKEAMSELGLFEDGSLWIEDSFAELFFDNRAEKFYHA